MRKRSAISDASALYAFVTMSSHVDPETRHATRAVESLNTLLTALARQGMLFDIKVSQFERGGVQHPGVVVDFRPLLGTGAGGIAQDLTEIGFSGNGARSR